jgi:flagellar export protein FliJ
MKKFRFTLDAVRVVRQRAEKEALEAYSAAIVARQKAYQRLEEVRLLQAEASEETRQEMSAGCTSGRLRQRQSFHESLRAKLREAEDSFTEAEAVQQKAMQRLVQAKQGREVVDKAFERQRGAHQKQGMIEEAHLLDELAQRQLPASLRWQNA